MEERKLLAGLLVLVLVRMLIPLTTLTLLMVEMVVAVAGMVDSIRLELVNGKEQVEDLDLFGINHLFQMFPKDIKCPKNTF